MNYNSISEIRELLQREGLTLKKRYGQNYLIDERVRTRIATCITEMITKSDHNGATVWEIGPGIGSLTSELVRLPYDLHVFEIDHGVIRVLERLYRSRITIHQGDFLKTLTQEWRETELPLAVVGNLPYSSASAMIAALVESTLRVPSMVFLVQTELAERLAAPVGTKAYSALSVLVQSHYTVARCFDVGGQAFFPRPQVGSTLITLSQLGERPSDAERSVTSLVARRAFAQRRKTLRNTLREHLPVLQALGIDPALRPEQLSPAQFRCIARAIAVDSAPKEHR